MHARYYFDAKTSWSRALVLGPGHCTWFLFLCTSFFQFDNYFRSLGVVSDFEARFVVKKIQGSDISWMSAFRLTIFWALPEQLRRKLAANIGIKHRQNWDLALFFTAVVRATFNFGHVSHVNNPPFFFEACAREAPALVTKHLCFLWYFFLLQKHSVRDWLANKIENQQREWVRAPSLTYFALNLSFLRADSEDSDQTERIPVLVWFFAGRRATMLAFSRRGSLMNTRMCLWMAFEQRKCIVDIFGA